MESKIGKLVEADWLLPEEEQGNELLLKRYKVSFMQMISGELVYSMVSKVNSIILYILLRG